MRSIVSPAVAIAAALTACSQSSAPAENAAPVERAAAPVASSDPASPDPEQAALAKAEAAAKTLGGQLKGALMQALSEGTPADALEMCAGKAQTMTAGAGERAGAKVGRSSLRLRNPDNAPPDWVAGWLQEQGERPVDGVKGLSRVDETPDGKVARFLAPIGIEPPCTQCHGPQDSLAEGVAAGLAARYPNDAAVGYAVGDLRGALWAEVPVQG